MGFLWGIFGILVVFAIGFAFSTNRKAINWRIVIIRFSGSSYICVYRIKMGH